jgi:ABC-2 type transport system ATP-binding protein
MIEVEGLSKTYRVAAKQPGLAGTLRHFVRRRSREVVAVRGLSFAIEPGEMVGFLGANGAGKTTTLRAIAGTLEPDAGRIQVAGVDTRREPCGKLRSQLRMPRKKKPQQADSGAE